MATFAELAAAFPLFEAPVVDASNFIGADHCSLCDSGAAACFELDVGCTVMQECATCRIVNGLEVSDAASVNCRACEDLVVFPELPDEIVVCHTCLRDGRAAITKDTELGMVSWEQAFEGVTHGVPGLTHPDFELVPRGDDWVGARVPQASLFELLRTPTYETIQGERWLFCCGAPMVFLGSWSQDRFTREAPDGDGRAYFEAIVEDCDPRLWEAELGDDIGIYVFRCAGCARRRGNWDVD